MHILNVEISGTWLTLKWIFHCKNSRLTCVMLLMEVFWWDRFQPLTWCSKSLTVIKVSQLMALFYSNKLDIMSIAYCNKDKSINVFFIWCDWRSTQVVTNLVFFFFSFLETINEIPFSIDFGQQVIKWWQCSITLYYEENLMIFLWKFRNFSA